MQYSLSYYLSGYPRKDVAREYKENIENFISRGGLNPANLKLGTKSIHKADVRSAKNNYITNFITTNRTGTT